MEWKKNAKWWATLMVGLFMGISAFPCGSVAETLKGKDYVRLGKMITLEGTLVQQGNEWALKVGDTLYDIHLGPSQYRERKGFSLKEGEAAKVTGFGYGTNVSVISMETSGKAITLRDQTGRPAWAGSEYAKGPRGGSTDRGNEEEIITWNHDTF